MTGQNDSVIRVAIYIRVSTKMQGDKYSLSAQTTELTRYAVSQKWQIVNIFKDVDSGGKLDKSGLNSLLDAIEEGKVDIVLCVDQDRLSRLDTLDWEYLKSILREHNVKIAEPGNIVDLSNDDQEFFSDLKNLIAKREKKTIVRRMMRGKKERTRNGKAWGKPLFEYVYDRNKGTYIAKEEWKWVIPFIDNLYLNEQLGMKLIADRLNEISNTPTGNQWNEHLVQTRIMSKAFHGVMEKIFSSGEVICVNNIFEPLRTEETYNLLQIERAKRGHIYNVTGRKGINIHILKRTNITCGICNRKIGVAQHGTKSGPRYYLKHGRKRKISDGSQCNISINTVRVDGNILRTLKEYLIHEKNLFKYMNLRFENENIQFLNSKINEVNNQIKKFSRFLDKLLELYVAEEMDLQEYSRRKKQTQEKIDINKKMLMQWQERKNAIETSEPIEEILLEYMGLIDDFELEMTKLEIAQLFGDVFPNAILHGDQLTLLANHEYKVPLIDISITINPDPFTWHPSKN